MPTYDYKCDSCGNVFEEFQSMKDLPLKNCPKCKNNSLVRLFGSGSGMIFKGSGFYLTDYKTTSKESTKKVSTEKKSEQKNSQPPSTSSEKKS